jgi:hypothetical protein
MSRFFATGGSESDNESTSSAEDDAPRRQELAPAAAYAVSNRQSVTTQFRDLDQGVLDV